MAFDADNWLTSQWRGLMDDGNALAMARMRGKIIALNAAGFITDAHVDLWTAAIDTCPGNHEACRVWCAYCGDLTSDEPKGATS